MTCFSLLNIIHPFSRSIYVIFGFLILAFGILLFLLSGRIRGNSGLSAILDLFTSFFGVCVLTFFLSLFRQQIGLGALVALSIACGVLSSASFRWRLRRSGKVKGQSSSR